MRNGFTFVELLVATAILGAALSAGIFAVMTYRRFAVAAERQTAAVHNARAVLEQVSGLHFHDPALNKGQHEFSAGIFYEIEEVDGMKHITVTVPWFYPATGREMEVALTTKVGEALEP